MTTQTTLREKVEALAVAREESAAVGLRYREAYDAWIMEIGEGLMEPQRQAKKKEDDLLADLKLAVMAAYRETDNRKPEAGVEIRMVRLLSWDPAEALRWALEKEIAMIPAQLDAKAYEALVKIGQAPGEVIEEPTVFVARDLAKALKGD